MLTITTSQLAARSRANSTTFNRPILTRHRSTAELQVVGIETIRTESLAAESTPESNNTCSHVSPTHPQKAYQLLRWPNSFTQRVYSQLANLYVCTHVVLQSSRSIMTEKQEQLMCTQQQSAVIAHRLWAYIGSIPWATSKSTSLPASVVARGV